MEVSNKFEVRPSTWFDFAHHKSLGTRSSKFEGEFGRIGVLMGGPSSERDISFKSGRAVCSALLRMNLDAVAIDITTDSKKENIKVLSAQNIDCAFLALHGRFGEDGQIQNILEGLKIPYTGSGPKASKLAMDKVASRKAFKAAGLSVPRYNVIENKNSSSNPDFVLGFEENGLNLCQDKACEQKNRRRIQCNTPRTLLRAQRSIGKDSETFYRNPNANSGFNMNGLGFPLVVKPASQGSSLGLSIIDTKKHLDNAIDFAFGYDDRIIVEEFISGRELTVGILEESALPVIEIIPKAKFFDFEAKYHSRETEYIVPAKLDEATSRQVANAALSAHRLLGCLGCSRVDIILSQDNVPFILEVNTIPGFTSTSLLPKAAKAKGIEFNELCFRLLKLAYEK